MATFLGEFRVRKIANLMKKNRCSLPKLEVCLKSVVFAGSLLASTLAFAEGEEHHHGTISDLIPYWINFSLYVLLLWFVLKNKISSGWTARRAKIAAEVSAAQAEKDSAERALDESRRLLATVDSQIKTAKDQITKQAQFETQEIIAQAKDKAARVVQTAKENAEAGNRTALRAISKEMVQEALSRARSSLQKDARSGSDQRYRSSAVGSSSRLIN